MRLHKAGTLGDQCAGEEKKNIVDTPDVPDDDTNNPWSYNNITPEVKESPVKVKQEKVEDLKSEEDTSEADEKCKSEESKIDVNDENASEASGIEKDDIKANDVTKKEPKSEDDVSSDVEIKKEPLDEGEVKIKEEPLDGDLPVKTRKLAYADGIYKAAPIVLDSDSDEFEPESDESAPSDDDVESHLGLTRRLNFKPKAKKRKKLTPANGTVMYMKNSAGQMVKKHLPQKESTRWVPPHPWVPYRTQVTVEQVCQFLEMTDYPIVANEYLRKKFEDKQAFEDYARPLFEKVNPDAHPLTLMTLIKAKWFELMNYNTSEEVEDPKVESKSQVQSVFATKEVVKPPLPKRIKLNWTL